jgi:hypothetical protein
LLRGSNFTSTKFAPRNSCQGFKKANPETLGPAELPAKTGGNCGRAKDNRKMPLVRSPVWVVRRSVRPAADANTVCQPLPTNSFESLRLPTSVLQADSARRGFALCNPHRTTPAAGDTSEIAGRFCSTRKAGRRIPCSTRRFLNARNPCTDRLRKNLDFETSSIDPVSDHPILRIRAHKFPIRG